MIRVVILCAALACAIFIYVSGAIAADHDGRIAQQIHEPQVCWEPDIEFPVPCDDEDD